MKKAPDALRNWNVMNAGLMKLGESKVAALLEAEKRGRGRLTVLLRLHGRFNKLRWQRERAVLTKVAKR